MYVLTTLRGLAQRLGPYLLIELLVPGGSLLALLFFLYERGKGLRQQRAQGIAVTIVRGLGGLVDQCSFQPCYARLSQALKPIRREP